MADVTDLFRASLIALRVPDLAAVYTPAQPPLWRLANASARITGLLSDGVAGEIALFVPVPGDEPERELRCRAAPASTPGAGLELARNGEVRLSQTKLIEPITVKLPPKTSHIQAFGTRAKPSGSQVD